MMRIARVRVLAGMVLALGAFLVASLAAAGVDGSWEGKLQTGGGGLRIVFNIASTGDGALKVTMDSPDQGAYGIAVDNASFIDNSLRCEIKIVSGVFEGKLNETDRSIDGFWTQYGVPMALNLKPKATTARKRPQEPSKPYPYVEEEVSFENSKAGVKFAGTLTKPKQGKKFPAVLLITGSGPQNRDEEIMGHKPFLLIADYLTQRGIAVLRVDDRGVGGTTRGSSDATIEDLAQDALSAIAYLKSRADIDKKHIGLVGHSEGGLIAPLAATQSKDVAYIVLLASPGVSGADLLVKQSDAIQSAQGIAPAARALTGRLQQRLLDIATQSSDEASAVTAFDKYWAERSKESSGAFAPSDAESAMMDNLAKQLRPQVKALMSPGMQYFLRHDPAPTLQKVTCPVLAINGSLDTQVVAAQNLPPIEAALKAGGNKDYTVKSLPGLNHLFQTATTGAPREYVEIEETMNVAALQLTGDWIERHAKK